MSSGGDGARQAFTTPVRHTRQLSTAKLRSSGLRSSEKSGLPTNVACLFGLSCRICAGQTSAGVAMSSRKRTTALSVPNCLSPSTTSWFNACSVGKCGSSSFISSLGTPQTNTDSFVLWRLSRRKRLPLDRRKSFDSVMLFVAWKLWGMLEFSMAKCSLLRGWC
jgi:hypothetical protein